jgi:hypothetical protein
MTNYSIFGSGAPAGISYDGTTTTALELFMAFHLTSGTGYQITGAKVWLDATGDNGSGYSAYLWQGTDLSTASPIASASFPSPMGLGMWNTVSFPTPVTMTAGNYYWISVHFPRGRYSYKNNVFDTEYASADLANLYGAVYSAVTPSNGAFNLSPSGPGAPPSGAGANHTWYGIDAIISDGGTPPGTATGADSLTITDAIIATRGGLPASVTVTGTATDTLGAAGTDVETAGVSGSTQHSNPVSMMGNRIFIGSPISRVSGPTLVSDTPYELGVEFQVKKTTRITGARIYKHPQAAGSIPVTLWGSSGTALATKTVTWASDGGGWVEVDFDTPVTMQPGDKNRMSYFAANGHYAGDQWFYNAQEMYEPPFWVGSPDLGPAANVVNAGTHAFPDTRGAASCYWIDVLGEVDQELPAYGAGFMQTFSNYKPKNAFPVAVYYPDAPYVTQYYDIGVNTIMNVPLETPGYREAILARNVDVWAAGGPAGVVSDPDLAAHVQGYVLGDEPDMAPTWVDPQTLRSWLTGIRQVDSSRPIFLNFGAAVALAEGWSFLIPGQSLTEQMTKILDQMSVADVVSCDQYNLEPKSSNGFGGVWTYARQVRRMRQFTDGLKPVWAIVETTSQEPGYPLAADVEKAVWAALIAGAKGIIFFDHRFGDAVNTQNFAAMLADAAMKAKVTALSATLQALAPALLADEAGLGVVIDSSNKTAGPVGGTYGVPIELTTRQASGVKYAFAQASRPSTTTGTFWFPSAAGKTITVINESRTITADGSGNFTDGFAADYSFHLYQWT